jgi:hypothetical protein
MHNLTTPNRVLGELVIFACPTTKPAKLDGRFKSSLREVQTNIEGCLIALAIWLQGE